MSEQRAFANAPEKERLRREIEAQVEEFLNSGGRIDVMDVAGRSSNRLSGVVWHEQVPLSDLPPA